MRVLAARDLLAVEDDVRDRVEPRDDEVDGGLRERRRGVDIKGALKGPDLLRDEAVLALVEAVVGWGVLDRACACQEGGEKRSE